MEKALKHRRETAARASLREHVPGFLRDSVVWSLVLFLSVGGITFMVFARQSDSRITERLEQLRAQGQYAASLVDLRAHSWLRDASQTTSQPFTALTERLQRIRDFFPGIGNLFTGRLENGQVRVILKTYDPAKGPDREHVVGKSLEPALAADSPEYRAISDRQIFTTATPTLHPGARWLTVIVPLQNPENGIRDFVYLDIDMDDIDAQAAAARKQRDIALLLAAVLAAIAGSAAFSWRSQSFYRQALATAGQRENEELFRSTYELSPVAMYLTQKDGRIIRANAAFCQLTGYTEEELRDLDLARLLPKEDLKKEEIKLLDLETHQISQYQTERRYVRKDGTFVWGLASVAIVRDSDLNISHYMTQVVDISERIEAEDVVRLSEERLLLATEAGSVGTWDYDPRQRTFVWNAVMHQIYRTDASEKPPTFDKFLLYVHPEDRSAVETRFLHCLSTGEPYRQEFRIIVKEQVRHLREHAVIFRDNDGRALRAVGTAIDITKEKEESQELIRAKEAAMAADKAKSEFLAVMSHEIRTPLNGVLGFVSMLKNTPLDSEQQSYVETMESSGQGLLSLVNDILDLSKIESKEIHVESSTFEIRPFIRRIHQQLQSQAMQRGLKYDYFVEYAVPKNIHTDQMRLGQILTNILGNALKFTEEGSVDLSVSAKPLGVFQKNWEWRFTIRDTGPGIPQDGLNNLFKLFYQVDSSATRRHGGTGLGLAISQRLVKLLGGDIEVRSEVGYGSEFTIVLTAPRGASTNALDVLAPAAKFREPIPTSNIAGKRILVVEDNPVNRKLCALQLRRLGCDVEFAETGLEALEKVRQGSYDAVLMDMQLPDLDGCGTTKRIRREILGGDRLSIIALTANAMPEDRKRCLDAGMDDFLSKPLQYETLASTLSKWVK